MASLINPNASRPFLLGHQAFSERNCTLDSMQTSSVVATVDILSILQNVETLAFSVLDQGPLCLGVFCFFFPSSFLTCSKNISSHKNRDDGIHSFGSSSFRGLGIMVWKFNTKDLFLKHLAHAGIVRGMVKGSAA